jgi:hypothetical protein
MIARINNYIQRRLQQENLELVPLKKVAKWLAEEGILQDTLSSPGFPLRRHVGRDNIFGATKIDQRYWVVVRLKKYEEILDSKDLTEIFGLKSRTSLYRKIKKEKIPFIRNRKKGIYFQISNLLTWALDRKDKEIFHIIQKKYSEIKRESLFSKLR